MAERYREIQAMGYEAVKRLALAAIAVHMWTASAFEELPTSGPHPRDTSGFDLEGRRAAHWAWQPLAPVYPPRVHDDAWPRSPIDRFILKRLESEGLAPAGPAEPGTLLRRAYFDLIGLPPSPQDVETFLADSSPEAFAEVVDRLLASPQFGERWARHWLDLVRYAETYGHEGDYPIRNAWQYRDYVIRALNADLPYNRFVAEHIAGDLLENPRRHPTEAYNESIIGTGFWYMHQATHSPVDVRQDQADRIDNQIDVFGKAFLGMTVACARCHDHKFDAISSEDYYGLAGILRSSRQQFAFLDPRGAIARGVRELLGLRETADGAVTRFVENAAIREDLAAPYLLAAREVFTGRWQVEDGIEFLQPDIVFDDFETGSLQNWTLAGEAFKRALTTVDTTKSPEIHNVQGRYFLNTYDSGDEKTGRLLSRPFLIERRYLRFRIGGAKAPFAAGVRLIVDGSPVRWTTGNDRQTLEQALWDVHEFRGKTAALEVVDESSAPRGNIKLDDIVFSEQPRKSAQRRPIASVAREYGLDETRLANWVKLLQDPALQQPSHLLYAWSSIAATGEEGVRASTGGPDDGPAHGENVTVLFEDFDDGQYEGWSATGVAFGDAPTAGRAWTVREGRPAIVPPGVAHSAGVSTRLQGILRSDAFTITHDNIHYRAAGRGGWIRLVIEGYALREFNGLLFEGTLTQVDSGDSFVWFHQTRDISKFKGRRAYIELIDESDGYLAVDEIRFSNGPLPKDGPNFLTVLAASARPGESATPIDTLARVSEAVSKMALNRWLAGSASAFETDYLNALFARGLVDGNGPENGPAAPFAALAEREKALPAPMRVLAVLEGTPEDEFVHLRGNYKDSGQRVPRRFLAALAGDSQESIRHGSGRLELARRLFDSSNPLPARVMVNRVWHHLFGRGITSSVDNFGVLGQPPSHPELLDYLAAEFQRDGWSVKGLIRRTMLSSTYQQSSTPQDEAAEQTDPGNTLLHRARVRRLQGEVIRDSVLAVSSTLDPKMYGPPVRAYLSEFMKNRRSPKFSGPPDGDGRRSVYLEVRRNFLSPFLSAFDLPQPDTTQGRRTVSNVPAQALGLMNAPFVIEQAEAWSKGLLAAKELNTESRIARLFLTAFSRRPAPEEVEAVLGFLSSQAHRYGIEDGRAQTDARVWADLCHVMFTAKEFIFIG